MPIINAAVAVGALPATEQQVIAAIRQRNEEIARKALGPDDYAFLGAVAARDFDGIRSAHGVILLEIRPMNVTLITRHTKRLFPSLTGPHTKVKHCWFSYAEASATGHAHGEIPTLIEFSGTGGGRIMLDYVRDLVIYTPDHYATYHVVTEAGGAALRTMQ